jgi:hypothetical protein
MFLQVSGNPIAKIQIWAATDSVVLKNFGQHHKYVLLFDPDLVV